MTTTASEIRDKAIDKGVDAGLGMARGLLPGFVSSLPGAEEGQEKIRKLASESIRNAAKDVPWITQLLTTISEWFSNLLDNLLGGAQVAERTNMRAKVGLDARGKSNTTNPFAAVDSALGINVSNDVKAECDQHIDAMIGILRPDKDPAKAISHTMAAHKAIVGIYYDALREKYGTKPEDEDKLEAIAQKAASAVTGLNGKTLGSKDAAHWLGLNPPSAGLGALLYNDQKTGAVSDFKLNAPDLAQATADIASYKTQFAQNSNKAALAAAAEATQNTRDTIGASTDVPKNAAPTTTPVASAKPAPKEKA